MWGRDRKRFRWQCLALLSAFLLWFASDLAAAEPIARRVTGTFLQIDRTTLAWTVSDWRRELNAMKRLGMDTLIVQATATESGAYYRSSTIKRVARSGCPDLIGSLLQIGKELGIQVFLGLQEYDVTKVGNSCQQMVTRSKIVASELAALYGKRGSFAGWYLPREFSDWLKSGEWTRAYAQLADHCRTLGPNRPVAIAPYFTTRSLNESACHRGWLRMLPLLRVDIVMLQDGIGCNRGLTVSNVAPVYRAVSQACRTHGVEFWSDLEVFDMRDWSPAPIDRIIAQLKVEGPHVKKIVIWEFNHYMSPFRGDRAKRLYDDYRKIAK